MTSTSFVKKYKEKALLCHPDKVDRADSSAAFVELKEAYDILGNEQLREQYDEEYIKQNRSLHASSDQISKNFEEAAQEETFCQDDPNADNTMSTLLSEILNPSKDTAQQDDFLWKYCNDIERRKKKMSQLWDDLFGEKPPSRPQSRSNSLFATKRNLSSANRSKPPGRDKAESLPRAQTAPEMSGPPNSFAPSSSSRPSSKMNQRPPPFQPKNTRKNSSTSSLSTFAKRWNFEEQGEFEEDVLDASSIREENFFVNRSSTTSIPLSEIRKNDSSVNDSLGKTRPPSSNSAAFGSHESDLWKTDIADSLSESSSDDADFEISTSLPPPEVKPFGLPPQPPPQYFQKPESLFKPVPAHRCSSSTRRYSPLFPVFSAAATGSVPAASTRQQPYRQSTPVSSRPASSVASTQKDGVVPSSSTLSQTHLGNPQDAAVSTPVINFSAAINSSNNPRVSASRQSTYSTATATPPTRSASAATAATTATTATEASSKKNAPPKVHSSLSASGERAFTPAAGGKPPTFFAASPSKGSILERFHEFQKLRHRRKVALPENVSTVIPAASKLAAHSPMKTSEFHFRLPEATQRKPLNGKPSLSIRGTKASSFSSTETSYQTPLCHLPTHPRPIPPTPTR